MHKSVLKNRNVECDVYDNIMEVQELAGYLPPRYCNKDATELRYYSFFDSLNRFTLKACCPKCGDKWAVSVSKEKYEAKMYERWAERVKERDGNRCRMESIDCSGPLHAHHMLPKAAEPAKMYDVENGITLCEFHHKKIHHYM